MPTYDYQCKACGHTFAKFQSMLADPDTICPECEKPELQRLFGTGSGVMFKGSGFYETDYRSESYKKQAAADSKASSEANKSSDSKKSESKSSGSKDSSSSSSSSSGSSD